METKPISPAILSFKEIGLAVTADRGGYNMYTYVLAIL